MIIRILLFIVYLVQPLYGNASPDPRARGPLERVVIGNVEGVIFPAGQAKALLNQCSRPAPQAKDFWTPTKEDIVRLEKLLPEYVKAHPPALCKDLEKYLAEYKRQYGGLLINGRRIIYVSSVQAVGYTAEIWQKEFAGICDGGCSAWGIEFDVDSEKFSDFGSNGVM